MLRCLLFCQANYDFGVAINSTVEFLMRIGSWFDLNSMADDLAWLGAAVYDQIAQIFVAFLDGRLPAAQGAPLVEEFCD